MVLNQNLMIMDYRIKEILKEKGISQKDLAEKLGISPPSLSQSLNGNATINLLEKIADALGVPLFELFAERETGVITCPHCGKKILVEAKQAQSANDGAKQSE